MNISVLFLPKWVVLELSHLLVHIHLRFLFIALHLLIIALHLLAVAFHLVLPLLVEDILLVEGIDLALDTHLSICILLLLSLHLHHASPLHLEVPLLVVLLCHPHLVVLYVVVVHYLVASLLLDGFLAVDVSQLGNVVGLIELLLDEPVLHLSDSRIVHQFLSFGIL